MGFPTASLDQLRSDPMRTAVPGTLVSVWRNEAFLTGIALGAAGVSATHLLVEEDDGVPWVYAIATMAETLALHRPAGARLLLDTGDNKADGRRMRTHVGCLGLTGEGLVLGAASGRDGFRDYTQVFVALSTFAVLDARNELFVGAQWLTNWSLSYQTATDAAVRLFGNPPWPEGAGVGR